MTEQPISTRTAALAASPFSSVDFVQGSGSSLREGSKPDVLLFLSQHWAICSVG